MSSPFAHPAAQLPPDANRPAAGRQSTRARPTLDFICECNRNRERESCKTFLRKKHGGGRDGEICGGGCDRRQPEEPRCRKPNLDSKGVAGNGDPELEEGEIAGEEDLAEQSVKEEPKADQLHPIEHSWTFWFDNPTPKSKQMAWGASMHPIYTFSTVEEFWSVKVFCCQLPRDNSFYLSEPLRHDGSDKPLGSGAPLCNWCGTWKGDKICGICREARYCSEKYQATHWHSSHKVMCQNSSRNAGNSSVEDHKLASRSLWPEHKIVNEDEAKYNVDLSTSLDNTNCLVSRNQMDD